MQHEGELRQSCFKVRRKQIANVVVGEKGAYSAPLAVSINRIKPCKRWISKRTLRMYCTALKTSVSAKRCPIGFFVFASRRKYKNATCSLSASPLRNRISKSCIHSLSKQSKRCSAFFAFSKSVCIDTGVSPKGNCPFLEVRTASLS